MIVVENMFDGAEYSSASECYMEVEKRRRNRNKRRFSDDQIRSLEVMFESDTKLEPRKKVQLAKELGLQPRQIAIWFQNRRARWKSKQIEKDYAVLLADYNNLSSQLESLKKENHSLSLQLERLKNEMSGKKIQEAESSSDGESDNTNNIDDFEVKNKALELEEESELLKMVEQESELLKMVEPTVDGSLTSSEDWGSLDSDDLINQQSYEWWDFWG